MATINVSDSTQTFENVMFGVSDSHYNMAYSTVATAPSPATTGTQLTLNAGDGVNFSPGTYNAIIWPAGGQPLDANAEIVRITGKSGDTLQIQRTQENTVARSIQVGDQIASSISAKTLTDVEGYANPVGSVNIYAGSVVPIGWLICNGGAVSRTTYANLFAVIGTSFGTGDGSTTFNVPDLRGRSPMGSGTGTATGATAQSLGSQPTSGAGGEQTHVQALGELAAHTHTTTLAANSTAGGSANLFAGNNTGSSSPATSSVGSSTAFNILHPISILNFIIKF